MPRTHPPYAPEYRRRLVELVRAGRPIAELAREFEASANAIRKWVKQAGLDEGLRSDGLTTAEREELNRLRRENRVLREEREILSKAAAWFATETGSGPSRRSNSGARIRPGTGLPRCAEYWRSPPAATTRGANGRAQHGRAPTRDSPCASRRFMNVRARPTVHRAFMRSSRLRGSG